MIFSDKKGKKENICIFIFFESWCCGMLFLRVLLQSRHQMKSNKLVEKTCNEDKK